MTKPRQSTERIVWSKTTGKAVTHGRSSSYKNHGCRCDECFQAFFGAPGMQKELALRARARGPLRETENHA